MHRTRMTTIRRRQAKTWPMLPLPPRALMALTAQHPVRQARSPRPAFMVSGICRAARKSALAALSIQTPRRCSAFTEAPNPGLHSGGAFSAVHVGQHRADSRFSTRTDAISPPSDSNCICSLHRSQTVPCARSRRRAAGTLHMGSTKNRSPILRKG
jgi:hypothetical protein